MSSRRNLTSFGISSLGLSLLSRVYPLCCRCCSSSKALTNNTLPCGFLPLRRFPSTGQPLTSQDYQSWVTVPSQRFSRSQGFHPPATCRPYFMPDPPLGFHPSGPIPLAKPSTLSNGSALLGLAPLAVAASVASFLRKPRTISAFSNRPLRSNTSLDSPHFRALLLTSVRVFCRHIYRTEDRDPRVSTSLGISPSPAAGFPRSLFLSWTWLSPCRTNRQLPFRVLPPGRSAGLFRVCHPFRGLPPHHSIQSLRRVGVSGLPLRFHQALPPSEIPSSRRLPRCRSSLG